jgi:hypothetical protein
MTQIGQEIESTTALRLPWGAAGSSVCSPAPAHNPARVGRPRYARSQSIRRWSDRIPAREPGRAPITPLSLTERSTPSPHQGRPGRAPQTPALAGSYRTSVFETRECSDATATRTSGILAALTPSQCYWRGRGPPPIVTGLGSPREGKLSLRERLATAVWRAARPTTPQSVIRSWLTTGSIERHAAGGGSQLMM